MLTLGHIELFVKDPLASRRFYEEMLGFEVVDVQAERFVWLKLGGTEILLRPAASVPVPANYQHAACGIVLYTDHLEATKAELVRRECCPTFTDPDGHWFQLVDPEDHT